MCCVCVYDTCAYRLHVTVYLVLLHKDNNNVHVYIQRLMIAI